ncbi:MAG: tail fiber protein [Candidatus Nanopelagicales bacterium]|jgi:microcystin-dependent protein
MSHYAGDVFLWTSTWDKTGIQVGIPCDGSIYDIDEYPKLYAVLEYRGQVSDDPAVTTFATPDLTGSAPEGLTPYIVTTGTFPPAPYDRPYYSVVTEPYLGEVDYTTETYPSAGWAFCDGSLVNIKQYTVLFSIIGNNFGGNGTTTFGLPNISGAVIAISGAVPARG